MTSRTISPVIRALAPAAALALFLSACGGSDDAPGDGEDASAASDEENEGSAEETQGNAPGRSSFGGPGILAADCSEGDIGSTSASLTLYSAEDGSPLHAATFSTLEVKYAVSEELSHGRAVETDTLTLPEMCTGEPGIYIPDRGMVLATFQEEVNGNTVPGFGVLDEHGTFTALSPEQEVSDFATPIEYINSVADPEGDRILFVEDDGEDTLSIQAIDLESGEITDIGSCPTLECHNLTVIPGLDAAVIGNLPFNDLLPVLGGSAIIASTGSGNMHFIDLGDHADDDVINLDEVFDTREILGPDPGPDVPPNVVVEGRGPITAIDDNSVVFEDNVLTVWEFTESTFTDYEAEHSDTLQHERPALPATATLVPEGPRENSDPNVSPDGTEVIFLSNPETGGSSWYRVPVDGSSEPEEFPEFPSNVTVLSWT